MAKYYWICPTDGTKNYMPGPNEARIMTIVKEWDFCKTDGTPRPPNATVYIEE